MYILDQLGYAPNSYKFPKFWVSYIDEIFVSVTEKYHSHLKQNQGSEITLVAKHTE